MTGQALRDGASAAVLDWAVRHFGTGCAVLLYGSYAAGTDGPSSDLDCLVVLNRDRECDLSAARKDYVHLQYRLGFMPDLAHPVETFTLRRCLSLLRAATLHGRLEHACRARAPLSGDDDAREVFHAFTSPRLALQGLPVIRLLEVEALQLLRAVASELGCDGQRACPLHGRHLASDWRVSS